MSLSSNAAQEAFPSISGYQITEQLYAGERTAVYRAMSAERSSVVIKTMQQLHPDLNELLHFRNQYTITQPLSIPGVIRPLALELWNDSYALVMEDFGGLSLQKYTQTHSLALTETLSIAVQMSDILHALAQHRIVHKDIKPANILIHPGSKRIQLIDFSIASLLAKEIQAYQTPQKLEGTLAYIAPEQTGRMNRGIDYRTDFYGLGVTLYKLLTGELPFISTDPLELIHCHIAKPPTAPNQLNQAIPNALSEIVLKLMAKNAEDRYQSAVGLKHDLEQCLHQWKETGTVDDFQLGQRDASDRFLIPQKLYGREQEVKSLLEAFERVSQGPAEMMLVAGFSGIGKTAVINEIHKPITRQHGYFIKGKFDQFNRNIPFSAFVQAFRSLMGQLLSESDAQLAQWKHQILEAVGENGQIIIDVIPELENIIGKQPPAPQVSGSAAQNRFNLLLSKFVRIFACKEHPLVLFLDDLQWADSASLDLLKLLITDSDSGYLLALGAYRNNEVFPAHPLTLALEDIKAQGISLNTLTLKPLDPIDLNQLVADTLRCSNDTAAPLSKFIYQKTQGNPFFTTQFLTGLYEESCLTFNAEIGNWQCDLAQVQQLTLTDNVVKFMVGRLQKLPEQTQHVLKLAACIGNRFKLADLATICSLNPETVATSLWASLQEGFIIPESETYKFFQGNLDETQAQETLSIGYRFLHDRIQQAAYSLIPEEQKQSTHLKIGRQLWQSLKKKDATEKALFSIVNHLNIARDWVNDDTEREEIAKLNLRASQLAKASVAYQASRLYCYESQRFLTEASWSDNYEFRFELAIATIEAEYFNHNLEAAQQLSQRTLDKAQTDLDRIKVYELKILIEINQNRMNEAIALARDALVPLGIQLPLEPQQIQDNITVLRETLTLPAEKIANLVSLGLVEDETTLAAIRILTNASSAAYIANPTLYPAIVLNTVQQCMTAGNSPLAASAYSWYGALLCGIFNDIEAGYAFGKLSLKLLEKFHASTLTAKVSNMVNVFIRPWKDPLNHIVTALPNAIQSGFEEGDVEYALYAAVHYCNYRFYSGSPLADVCEAQERYLLPIIDAKYEFHEGFLRINQQVVANLLGASDRPAKLQGNILDGESCLSQWLDNNIVFLVLCFYEAQTRLAYLFEDYAGALEAGHNGWQYQQAALGTLYASEQNFYYSLALLAGIREGHQSAESGYELISANQKQLKIWAEFSPTTFQHKYDLVEAERNRQLGNQSLAISYYQRAITGAKLNNFLQEEALANELAAKALLSWEQEQAATSHLQEAYEGYVRWGAEAKITHLKTHYPQLLTPFVNASTIATLVSGDSLSNITSNLTLNSSTRTNRSTTAINASLDLAAVLKASQAISGTIQLDELLQQLTAIILQNSGGDRCTLLLPDESGKWHVKAITTLETTTLCSEAFDNHTELPLRLIQYVKNTQKVVIIDDLQTELPVIDDYLNQQQPKSLLCLPLRNQGHLIGILYVRNQSTKGVFTQDRLMVLKFLCTQAAISLENARLYQQSQSYAQQLEESQLQTVQSEKMASLGNLVAGVAHEINNPLGFLNGSLKNAQQYIQDLQSQIELYQEHYPNPVEAVQDNAEEIDLDFVCEDFPNLLTSMKRATDRIKSISVSLRTFSRADTEHKVSANLHEGLDSTLLILKYRLKGDDYRNTIQIQKDYGELPDIKCFPGRLNQVFMNLLANAIDAFDEAAQLPTYDKRKSDAQCITVKTAVIEQESAVEIRIIDNGKGMPPEVKGRIFEHLFTTKGVGKGTGLGLAIAKQIIVEAHGGTIDVQSEPEKGTEFCIRLPM